MLANGQSSAMPPSGFGAVRSSLNPNDPDYLKKMGLIGAIEGAHELQTQAEDIPHDLVPPSSGAITDPNVKQLAPSDRPEPMAAYDSLMQQKPAVSSLMDRARHVGGEHPGILGRIGRTAAEIGTGALEGGEALGEAAFPRIAGQIPGSFTNLEMRRSQAFNRGLAEERQQEQDEYREMMANVAQQKAETGRQHELTFEDWTNFRKQSETFNNQLKQEMANTKAAYMQGNLDLGSQRLSAQLDALQERYAQIEKNYDVATARNLISQEANAIRQEMVGVAQDVANERGADEGEKVWQTMAQLEAAHPVMSFLGLGEFPALEQHAAESVPQQAPIPPNTPAKPAAKAATSSSQIVSAAQLNAYAKKYNMTPAQAKTFLQGKGFKVQ